MGYPAHCLSLPIPHKYGNGRDFIPERLSRHVFNFYFQFIMDTGIQNGVDQARPALPEECK
ncbi:MAG TPA: hypothetical protein DCM26_05710 [Desulfotomaculum sp.]|nr:hypothetical protein [Desulfotomaculum sp.]